MKARTLKRSTGDLSRECVGDLRKQSRNLDPKHHPMARAREYQRAKTSAKLQRMFAKPFLGDFRPGHRDAVRSMAVSRNSLLPLVSGGADGSVKLWDVASRKQVASIDNAHGKAVNGVVFHATGQAFYTCSDDGTIHQFKLHHYDAPRTTWKGGAALKSIDHHWHDDVFATASSDAVQLWSPSRTTPVAEFNDLWGSADSVTVVRYHPSERSLLAQCTADRGIGLHDTRTQSNLKKTVLRMRSNDLCWNPLEPMTFCVGNEDYNAYCFDMRKLEQPLKLYRGHQGAVMSVSFSPTGREFVTGSYDSTIRIFPTRDGQSREIYHTRRMQRVWSVRYSMDNQYIVSASDDSNLRLWKAHASDPLGQLSVRQEGAHQYRNALVKRYQHLPEIRKIVKSRKVPKAIRNQTKQKQIQKESQQRKQANRVKYSKNGEHTFVSEKEKLVVKQVE